MIKKLIIVESHSLFPHFNQAIEASILELADEETMILYIWANDKTVFIGKNQNAFTECNVQKLKSDGGFLARRISGGGAVYHDKGNLNFTFACTKNNYSLKDNFAIVLDAVRAFGIDAQLSGRNDCTIEGKKFSGNAFYSAKNKCFHHGTVLINTRAAEIAKYLNVSTAKLNAKGVRSVVSRVTNLSEYNDEVSYKSFSSALRNSFISFWKGAEVNQIQTSDIDSALIKKWQDFFSDETRIMGDDILYNYRLERRFDWGTADIRLLLSDNVIKKCKIYTDSLDYDISQKETALIGRNVMQDCDDSESDIITAIKESLKA